MHPSHRYSSRYPNRSPEIGPLMQSPIPDLYSIRLTPPPSTRLDSTLLKAARSLHLPFFTLDSDLNLTHHKNQAPYPRKATPLASS